MGSIYKLQHEDGHFYIGSTITSLSDRLAKHKHQAKRTPTQPVYKYINANWDKVKIELIEEVEELLQKEDEYIQKELDNPLCLNSKRAFCNMTEQEYSVVYRKENKDEITRCKKEHYEANKDTILQQQKVYNQVNKEKISIRSKAYYEANKQKKLEYQRAYRARLKAKGSAETPLQTTD